ncbi:MAG TPA: hypothetical protein EYP43_04125 [Thermoplasmata archaeon]|nr:hypothetical protein [Thermoplasmata archaeon]
MKELDILRDHINGVGLWIVAQLSRPVDEEEFLRRAARAFPEVPLTTFVRSYALLVGDGYGPGHVSPLPVHATA